MVRNQHPNRSSPTAYDTSVHAINALGQKPVWPHGTSLQCYTDKNSDRNKNMEWKHINL